ncbi:MAG: ZIP family metal transporter [Bacteroidota bacterium]
MNFQLVLQTFTAALITALATGLGALPVVFLRARTENVLAIAWAFAGGMMLSASIFSLIVPAMEMGSPLLVLVGIVLGTGVFFIADRELSKKHYKFGNTELETGSSTLLIMAVMVVHSFPEGVAVGVGFGSGELTFGILLTIAIAIHNIPEGTAISIPLYSQGASLGKCVWYSILSSLPQPVAAVPAVILVSFFREFLPPSLGFAAGAMMYVVFSEFIPVALKNQKAEVHGLAVMAGIVFMYLLQVLLTQG